MKYIFRGMGGHARTIMDILPAGAEVIGYFDDVEQKNELKWLGTYDSEVHVDLPLILAVGNNKLREQWFAKSLHACPAIISKYAIASQTAHIGEATIVLPNAVIQSGATICKGAIVNICALIDHDAAIGDFCHIAAGAVVGSRVQIGNRVLVGAGAVVPPASFVPDDTVIAAGAVFNFQQ